MPWASTTAWCFVPFLPRSVGFGPVSSPPPRARAKELSTAARDQSILSAPCNSSSSTACRRTHTPACCHSTSRRRQRLPEPQFISRGRSFQLMPVLRTKRMPVRAWRFVSGLRPGKRQRRGLGGGSSGSIRCHSSSVNRGLAIGHTSGAKSKGTQVPTPCQVHLISPPFLRRFCNGWRPNSSCRVGLRQRRQSVRDLRPRQRPAFPRENGGLYRRICLRWGTVFPRGVGI